MKALHEIDCNDEIWDSITCQMQNGWSNLENECRFAYQTRSTQINADDIDEFLREKFPTADQVEVMQLKVDCGEPRTRYFGASVIIYRSID